MRALPCNGPTHGLRYGLAFLVSHLWAEAARIEDRVLDVRTKGSGGRSPSVRQPARSSRPPGRYRTKSSVERMFWPARLQMRGGGVFVTSRRKAAAKSSTQPPGPSQRARPCSTGIGV